MYNSSLLKVVEPSNEHNVLYNNFKIVHTAVDLFIVHPV